MGPVFDHHILQDTFPSGLHLNWADFFVLNSMAFSLKNEINFWQQLLRLIFCVLKTNAGGILHL